MRLVQHSDVVSMDNNVVIVSLDSIESQPAMDELDTEPALSREPVPVLKLAWSLNELAVIS